MYMLDTNTASFAIKNNPPTVLARLQQIPLSEVCISAITRAELLRGVAKKPEAKKLSVVVNEFLLRVETIAWDCDAAQSYAKLRTLCEKEGKSLDTLDMLIAAHSIAINAILVTNDQAFYHVKHLVKLDDWTTK